MNVNIFFRKRLAYTHSIEELFLGLIPFLSKTVQVKATEVPYSGGSPLVIIRNLRYALSKKSQINHVTGDIHYLTLAFHKNCILTIHDVKSALQGNGLKRSYIKLFWFWLPALVVRRITVISQFTKMELERIIPFAKHKIRVIHNPVKDRLRRSSYQFNSKCPVIMLIGTKTNKNLERTLAAIKGMQCKVLIVGPLTKDQTNLLKEYHIDYDNRVTLNFDGIVDCYNACDLLCFASTYEGFGMPIIEAQAIGRPVITSNMGAMYEVSGDSACEVNPFDIDSIKQGILKVCTDEAYRNQLIASGLENVKRFQPEVIAQQYLELYKEVLTE